MQNQNKPIAGRAVEGAANVVEETVRQVESAVVETTEFASEQGLSRIIGLIRAGKDLVGGGLHGLGDLTKDGGEVLIRELKEFQDLVEEKAKDVAENREADR